MVTSKKKLIPDAAMVRGRVFKKRLEGIKKKCRELSTLCGIDVVFLCSPPQEGSGKQGKSSTTSCAPHDVWPPSESEVLRILTRYRNNLSKEDRRLKHAVTTLIDDEPPELRSPRVDSEYSKISGKREEAQKRRGELLEGMLSAPAPYSGASEGTISFQPELEVGGIDHQYWEYCIPGVVPNIAHYSHSQMTPAESGVFSCDLHSFQLGHNIDQCFGMDQFGFESGSSSSSSSYGFNLLQATTDQWSRSDLQPVLLTTEDNLSSSSSFSPVDSAHSMDISLMTTTLSSSPQFLSHTDPSSDICSRGTPSPYFPSHLQQLPPTYDFEPESTYRTSSGFWLSEDYLSEQFLSWE
ncbi:hypothetical protein H6P81_020914 [Aristolochia fimbriata]|uniref:MADS-box domain-containing protein n=1 Tax=Aristolochia fimbriata TaxID=158543 RepID=A0AAV7DW51_ARIFI|nr:hypothetical protein H6P81_020914 [Aristolochia fimbriata]